MIKLEDKEKQYIDENTNGTIIIDNKKYYFKLIPSMSIGIEVAVENLAKLVDIKCAHYEVVEINGLNYYLCEDISGKDKFYTAYELGFYDYSLQNIWSEFELRYPEKYEYLKEQMIKIYIFDILLLNNDRNYGNFGFKFINSKIEDVYIFDNGDVFSDDQEALTSKPKFDSNLKNIPIELLKIVPEGFKESLDDLAYFLENNNEYYDLFINMYTILTPSIIEQELNKIDLDYQSKNDMINIYKQNYDLIGELIHKRGLK